MRIEQYTEEQLIEELETRHGAILRHCQNKIEQTPQTAKNWLCDVFRLMHTVDNEVLLQKVREAIQ